MKKILAALYISLMSSIFLFAQAEIKTNAGWTTFAPAQENFSIGIPVALDKSVYKNLESNRRYLGSDGVTHFYIFSDSSKNSWQCDFVRNFAANYAEIRKVGTIGDYETEKFEFYEDGDFYHTILIARGTDRTYAFQTVSAAAESASAGRFFGSLKLKNNSYIEKSSEPELNRPTTIAVPPSPIIKERSSFNTGTGTKYRIKESNSDKKRFATAKNVDTDLKILIRPGADFTDHAKFYEMKGRVTLRVTFLADGTVGEISPLAKLPFGLTEQAVIAARAITFEPAMRNNKYSDITTLLQYSFTIK